MSATDECLSLAMANRGERPSVNFVIVVAWNGGVQFAQDLTFGRIVEHGKVEKVRGKIGAIGKFASHACLHVMIFLLTREREFENYLSSAADLEQSGGVARFRDDKRSVGGWLGTVDFALGAFPNQCLLTIGSDANDGSSTMTFGFVQRQNNRAVVEYITIASGGRICPARFPVGPHDVCLLAARQKTVSDVLRHDHAGGEAKEGSYQNELWFHVVAIGVGEVCVGREMYCGCRVGRVSLVP